MSIITKLSHLGPEVVDTYDQFAPHDRSAMLNMRPGESALWVGRRTGTFFLPVVVEGDRDLEGADWALATFDGIAILAEGTEGGPVFAYCECTGPGGEGTVRRKTPAAARKLLLSRVAGLLAYSLEDA